MEQGISDNTTSTVYAMHPCYEIVNLSYVLARSPSLQCVFLYVSLGSFSVVTVCGNSLVIISVGYFKQLHTPTNFLVLSLAVADVLVGLLFSPFNLAYPVTFCIFQDHLHCDISDGFDVALFTSSILHLCCIAVDRYCAVCKPLIYSAAMTNRVAAAMILVCWGISAINAVVLTVVGFNHGECEGHCSVQVLVSNVMAVLFSFYLPALVMITIYLKIFLVAQKQARRIHHTMCGAVVSKMERKATKTLAIVMGVFLLCLSPYFICLLNSLLSNHSTPIAVMEALPWLSLCNSMLNPFLYAFFYRWFRSAFKMVISGKIFQGDFINSKLL